LEFGNLSEEMALRKHSRIHQNGRQKLMNNADMEDLLAKLESESRKGDATCITVGIAPSYFKEAAAWLQDLAAEAAQSCS